MLAAPAAAATLVAQGSVAADERLAVTATGLEPGVRGAVFLSPDDFAGRPCLGRLARRTARAHGATVFSGRLPTFLSCPPGGIPVVPTAAPPDLDEPVDPPIAPSVMEVEPGHGYRLVVCRPAGDDCRLVPVDRVRVTVVPTGAECAGAPVAVRDLHARNVDCATARRIAVRATGGDLRYRGARLRCRGIRDRARGVAVYRCTRPGARVTFAIR